MEYLLATNNPGKVSEIEKIFAAHQLPITSLKQLGLFFEADEPWDTFEKNAMEKAVKTQEFLSNHGHDHIAVIADDSGLMIDALDGLPGVDSANFMGRDTAYTIRNQHLIDAVNQHEDRTARFVSVVVCVYPAGHHVIARGEVVGHIAHAQAGEGGFGYDPIFYVPTHGKTMAEISIDEKNKISHRGQAIAQLIKKIEKIEKIKSHSPV